MCSFHGQLDKLYRAAFELNTITIHISGSKFLRNRSWFSLRVGDSHCIEEGGPNQRELRQNDDFFSWRPESLFRCYIGVTGDCCKCYCRISIRQSRPKDKLFSKLAPILWPTIFLLHQNRQQRQFMAKTILADYGIIVQFRYHFPPNCWDINQGWIHKHFH